MLHPSKPPAPPAASVPGRCRASWPRHSSPPVSPSWPAHRSWSTCSRKLDLGQSFRIVTGAVEVAGAIALLVPGLASVAGLWLGATMVGAVATHLTILHTSPAPAVILGLLNALVVYLRRDELKALLQRVNK